MLIKKVSARKIKDSRGEYTIEVSVNGLTASSPSGKSKGKFETPSYHKSIDWNISAINSFKELQDVKIDSFDDLSKVESLIKKKFKLKDAKAFGANALFALESAVLKALAESKNIQLWQVINPKAKSIPKPLCNVIGGGLHSKCSPNLTFQELLLSPQTKTIKENYSIMKDVHYYVGKLLNSGRVNDEGAWETTMNEEEAFELLSKFKTTRIGVDIASSSFYKDKIYNYSSEQLDKKAQIFFVSSLIKKYNLVYVEDPLEENDFQGFSKISKSSTNLICGDDLTVTHKDRLKKAIKSKSINCTIIKPNQNGSLLELKEVFQICRKNKIKTVISHRSGETMDDALADYAVGFGADFIKCGIATRWRECKLNRLIKIEESMLR